VQEGKWIDLEDGVQVYFEPDGSYRTGDYWLVPARTATGNVLWPTNEENAPEALPPHGIEHHYAPLARLSLDGSGNVTCGDDCRCSFDPLCAAAVAAPQTAPAIETLSAEPDSTDTCADSRVAFSAIVAGTEPLKYAWNFGDGTTSAARKPTHHFAKPVLHKVTLRVANEAGEDSSSLEISVAPCERDERPVDERLTDLRRIEGVGDQRAKVLFEAGVTTPRAVAEMPTEDLRTLLNVGEEIARNIKTSARSLVNL
jgi:predicted flap endonuclease-1-like 5' DNA nuclease